MAEFSIKALDVTVGDVRFGGFTSHDDEHPLRFKRRLAMRGGRSWAWDEPLEPEWCNAIGVVERIAATAIEGAWNAKRDAEGAMWSAVQNRYRGRDYPRVEELQDRPGREPACSVRLRGVTIQVDNAWHGQSITASGSPMAPVIRPTSFSPDLPPALGRAIRYAHRLAYLHAGAALLDAASGPDGRRVPSVEGALTEVDLELGFLAEA